VEKPSGNPVIMGFNQKPNHKTGGAQMVKQRKKHSRKKRPGKGFKEKRAKARKINVSTKVETYTEQLSPFGGILAVIKFFDLIKFKEIFNSAYQWTMRKRIMLSCFVTATATFYASHFRLKTLQTV